MTPVPNGTPAHVSLPERMAKIRADAARRHVDFITIRGLAEHLGLDGPRLADLRHELHSQPTGEFVAPLWVFRPAEPREATGLSTAYRRQ